jgi:hypothetical protein
MAMESIMMEVTTEKKVAAPRPLFELSATITHPFASAKLAILHMKNQMIAMAEMT